MMSAGTKLILAKASFGLPPASCAHDRPVAPPASLSRILHLKGFGGGVPLNTETSTAKDLWLRSDQP